MAYRIAICDDSSRDAAFVEEITARWASEQNIYSLFHYLDRKGRMFTAEQCREELEAYKAKSRKYARRNKKPSKVRRFGQNLRRKIIYGYFYMKRVKRAVIRRLRKQ